MAFEQDPPYIAEGNDPPDDNPWVVVGLAVLVIVVVLGVVLWVFNGAPW